MLTKGLITIFLLASTAGAENWNENNGKREWIPPGQRTKVIVSHELEIISWPGLPDSTYFNVDLGALPGGFTWVGDTTIVNLDDYFDARFYNIGNANLEWEAVLHQKPGNQFSWTFPFTSNNLRFLYQDTIYFDRARGWPADSVQFSYAVYHSSRTWNEYTTGKAFHIYRPKAWDSAGDTVWLDLDIDTLSNEITLAGTRRWFRDAVYPVTIDPNFGTEDIGGTAENWTGYMFHAVATMGATAGTLDSIYTYYKGAGVSRRRYGIYTDDTDSPDALGDSVTDSVTCEAAGWYPQEIPGDYSLSANTVYWITTQNGQTGNANEIAVDACAGDCNDMYYDYMGGAQFYAWPNPTSATSQYDKILSIYAKYTEVGGAPAATDRRQILLRSE